MSKFSDQKVPYHGQYRNTKDLEAKAYLHKCFSVNKYSFNRWIFDRFPTTTNLNILELGCGTGVL